MNEIVSGVSLNHLQATQLKTFLKDLCEELSSDYVRRFLHQPIIYRKLLKTMKLFIGTLSRVLIHSGGKEWADG